jgi:hypothetical protein
VIGKGRIVAQGTKAELLASTGTHVPAPTPRSARARTHPGRCRGPRGRPATCRPGAPHA